MSDEKIEIYTEDWFKIASRSTFESLVAAVERHRQYGDGYLPLWNTLEKLIAEMAQERRDAAARDKTERFMGCGRETGGGVIFGGTQCMGGMMTFVATDGERYVKECACLIAYRRGDRTHVSTAAERREREIRHRREHPDEYVSLSSIIRDVAERKQLNLVPKESK